MEHPQLHCRLVLTTQSRGDDADLGDSDRLVGGKSQPALPSGAGVSSPHGHDRSAITADDGEILFFHFSEFVGTGYRGLVEGQRVSFVRAGIADFGRGAAFDVRRLD